MESTMEEEMVRLLANIESLLVDIQSAVLSMASDSEDIKNDVHKIRREMN